MARPTSRLSGRSLHLAQGIRQARRSTGLTQEAAAEQLGIHPVTLSQYERGIHAPGIEVILRMVETYKVAIDELLGLRMTPDTTIGAVREVPTRAYIATGVSEIVREASGSTPLPADIVDAYPDSFAVVVAGDAMARAGIAEGDRLLVDPHGWYELGHLFVVRLPTGEFVARRFSIDQGRARLRGFEGEYEDMSAASAQLLGRVVWHLKKIG